MIGFCAYSSLYNPEFCVPVFQTAWHDGNARRHGCECCALQIFTNPPYLSGSFQAFVVFQATLPAISGSEYASPGLTDCGLRWSPNVPNIWRKTQQDVAGAIRWSETWTSLSRANFSASYCSIQGGIAQRECPPTDFNS